MSEFERALRQRRATELLGLFQQWAELEHLRVDCRGHDLIVFSNEDGEKVRRARFTELGRWRYRLSLTRHTGAWEPTPFTGSFPELVELLVTALGFHLARY